MQDSYYANKLLNERNIGRVELLLDLKHSNQKTQLTSLFIIT